MYKTKEVMEFTEYEKMNNSMSKFQMNIEPKKTKWVVTEKIHGANFSFHTDGETVEVARRRGLLKKDENFFNYLDAEFMKTYPNIMKEVFPAVCDVMQRKDIIQVSIYGELFGGIQI